MPQQPRVFRVKHHNSIIAMSTFKNDAAWIMTEKAKEFEVKEGPVPNPAAEEVVIKVAYAAINPSDWRVSTTAAPLEST